MKRKASSQRPKQEPKDLEKAWTRATCDHKNGVSKTMTRQTKISTKTRHLIELLTEGDINFIEERS